MNAFVHFLRFGMTACMMDGLPKDWPPNHKWSGDWKDVTCPACIRGRNITPTFALATDGRSITCLRCHLTSHHPEDVRQHYCGHCKEFHDDLWPHARRWWVEHPDPLDKYYVGERREEGVMVSWRRGNNSEIMSATASLNLANHSPDGFEWGYGGSGPAQLALALLLDHLGELDSGSTLALQHYQRFKEEVVASFEKDRWQLHENQIAAWLRRHAVVVG